MIEMQKRQINRAESFEADSDIASLEMWQQVLEDNPNDEEAQGQFDYWWSRAYGGRDKPVFKVNEERKWFEYISNGSAWNGPNVLTNDSASFYRSCAECNTKYGGGGIHYWSGNDFSVCEECWNEKDGEKNANYMQAESFAADGMDFKEAAKTGFGIAAGFTLFNLSLFGIAAVAGIVMSKK